MYDEIIRKRQKFAKNVKKRVRNLIFVIILFTVIAAIVYGVYWYLSNNSGLF